MTALVMLRGTLSALVLSVPLFAAAQTHVVVIDGMQFKPAELTVQRGDKVVWQNKDLVPHTATAAGKFDTGNIAQDQSHAWVASAPGRYDYVCAYHPNMKAAVVVK